MASTVTRMLLVVATALMLAVGALGATSGLGLDWGTGVVSAAAGGDAVGN